MERRADRGLALVTSFLILFGLVMVYSASAPFSFRLYSNDSYLFLKQLLASALGIAILVFFARLDYHRLRQLDDVLLVGSFALTVLTILPLPGLTSGRWLHLGPLAIQPSELLKFSLVIYLAVSIDRRKERIASFTEGVLPYIVILCAIAVVLINQPDLGMLMLLGGLTVTMLYLGGARVAHLASIVAGSLPLIYLAVRFSPYRLSRIISFLNPQAHSNSSGYQITQSLLAIGSGGLIGRGLGASRTKLLYLPQAYNDFIFSVTAEELGLIGALVLIALLSAFVWRTLIISWMAQDRLGTLLTLGIGFTISYQVLLNLGVAMGLVPVTGLTLPFISNGGSSLLATLAMVGVVLSVSRESK